MVGEQNSEAATISYGGDDTSCSFQWDDKTQLYFHASSGFYHDPNAGWYYSSRDGLYYKFQNGNYVLLEQNNTKSDELEGAHSALLIPDNSNQMKLDKPYTTTTECEYNVPELPQQPPSEWLEEMLINLYLSNYSTSDIAGNTQPTSEANCGCVPGVIGEENEDLIGLEANCGCVPGVIGEENEDLIGLEAHATALQKHHACNVCLETRDKEVQQLIARECCNCKESDILKMNDADDLLNLDDSWKEEAWQAQYGQALQPSEAEVINFHIIDLWDWSMFEEAGKGKLCRLVGRLVKKSAKPHQSFDGKLLRTAVICEVHLNLVRVVSGKVYRLKTPSVQYLATLSSYDATNPTKEWDFPELNVEKGNSSSTSSKRKNTAEILKIIDNGSFSGSCHQFTSVSSKDTGPTYMDRAAQRRALYGGFGIGPGQKLLNDETRDEEMASEAEILNMSFGPGSYAQRVLESMDWKEGETLGRTNQGLLEPVPAISNKGNAGLGWNGT